MTRYTVKRNTDDGIVDICRVNSLERVGKWMGDRYVSVDVSSPTAIRFEVGDYIEYCGEKFTLNYEPSVLKQARSGTYGAAFVYNGIRFDGCTNSLKSIRFYDYVHGDSGVHFKQTRQFSFYCSNLVDFANRVQANLDRWYEEQQKVGVGFRFKRWVSRVNADAEASTDVTIEVQSQTVWQVLENVQSKFNTTFTVREHEDFCEIVYGDDGREDLEGVDAFEYGMNKGLLSIERSSQKDTDVQTYTRLRAYGSTKNLPAHYYSEPHEPWYKLKKGVDWFTRRFEGSGSDALFVVINVAYLGDVTFEMHFEDEPSNVYSNNGLEDAVMQFTSAYAGDDEFQKRYIGATLIRFSGSHVTDEMKRKFESDKGTFENLIITKGILKKYATHHKEWWISPYPINANNYAVLNLMLPKFYSYRVLDREENAEKWLNPAVCTLLYEDRSHPNYITAVVYKGKQYMPIYEGEDEGNPDYTRIAFNEDAYIDDIDGIKKYGIIEGDVYFESDDDGLSEIYPTIEGTRVDDAREAGYDISLAEGDNGYLDEFAFSAGQYYNENKEIKDAPTDLSKAFDDFVPFGTDGYGDDGVQRTTDAAKLWEGKKRQFYIFTKDLGFDPKAYLGTSDAEIAIKSGNCTGRSFKLLGTNNGVANNPVQVEKDGVKYWRFHCERYFDQTLGVHYPNNLDTISGEPVDDYRREDPKRGIMHSDRFVLLNFELPRMYVDAASARLQRAAEEYFDNTRKKSYIYVPKIDSVMMKRNRDMCDVTGYKSYHDILQEGLIMKITDEDLRIEEGIDDDNTKFYIETLTVKETGDKIPEYTVVLKDKAELTSLQKIQKQITTIGNKLTNIMTGNSNVVIYGNENNLMANGGNVGGTSGGGNVNEEDVTRIGDERYARLHSENTFAEENTFTTVYGEGFVTKKAKDGVEDYGASVLDGDGGSYVYTDYLNVRRAAFFRTLTIAEVEHMGGEVILSAAACQLADVSNRIEASLSSGLPTRYRCYFDKQSNGREVYNEWKVGDLAYCKRWNDTGDLQFYWRKIVAVGTLAQQYYIELSDFSGDKAIDSKKPAKNDNVVLLGHMPKSGETGYHDRTCAQVYSTIGADAPSRKYYTGITSFELPAPIEVLGFDGKNPHWKVGGKNSDFVEYKDGRLNIKAREVSIVSEGGTTNVADALNGKFDIWHSDMKALRDKNNNIEEDVPVESYDVGANWSDAEVAEHDGDYLITTDGVSYQLVGDSWIISSDRYLLNAMNFVSGFEQSPAFAKLFSKVYDAQGNVVSYAFGGTEIVDKDGVPRAIFKVDAGDMIVNAENFTLDEEGFVTLKGLLRKGHLVIDSSNNADYFPAQTLDLLKTNAAGYNYIELRYTDEGDTIILPSFNSESKLTHDELEGIREYIGQDVVIYNNTSNQVEVQGIFYEGFDHDEGGHLVQAQRYTSINIPGGYMMCAHCMATMPPTTIRPDVDNTGELVWWNITIRMIHGGNNV